MFPSGDLHHFVGHCAVDQGPDVPIPSPVEAASPVGEGEGSFESWGGEGEGGSFRPLVFQIFFFHFPVFLHVWTSGEALAGFG